MHLPASSVLSGFIEHMYSLACIKDSIKKLIILMYLFQLGGLYEIRVIKHFAYYKWQSLKKYNEIYNYSISELNMS